jgi:hypothetical protein
MSPVPFDPEDRAIASAFSSLVPPADHLERLERTVLAGLDARPPSLVREWLGLFSARPVINVAWLAAAACGLFAMTPLWALLAALATSGVGGSRLAQERLDHGQDALQRYARSR